MILFALSPLTWMGVTSLFIARYVCVIPGASLMMPSMCVPTMGMHQVNDFPALIYGQSAAFDQMLEKMLWESVGGFALSLDFKKSEIATKDLIALVKVSELKNHNLIVEALAGFAWNARVTSEGLQELSSHIKRMVDGTVIFSRGALANIDVARNNPGVKSGPWYAPWQSPPIDAIVLKNLLECMEYLLDRAERIMFEGSIQMKNLADLEGRLDVITELVSREGLAAWRAQDDVLSSLWMLLGRSKATLCRFDTTLSVMQEVIAYRKVATGTIVSLMHTSREMAERIQVVRERLTSAGNLMTLQHLELYEQSIESRLLRLKDLSLEVKERERTVLGGLIFV